MVTRRTTSKPGAVPQPRPCATCPYRRSVPSGIWDAEEYEKLPEYDREMPEQPLASFYCHQRDGSVCSGWLGHREYPSDLLAVRLGVSAGHLDVSCIEYETDVPLFQSGAEAAAHGMRDIEHPGRMAQKAIDKIVTKREEGTSHGKSKG